MDLLHGDRSTGRGAVVDQIGDSGFDLDIGTERLIHLVPGVPLIVLGLLVQLSTHCHIEILQSHLPGNGTHGSVACD
jgi:hypothetical protein